ncbi:MAG: TRAP transporter large permease [Oscillospiraceae bacterium]|nr:TRAP transporter large permease [Oscillospiraceae bacterium]
MTQAFLVPMIVLIVTFLFGLPIALDLICSAVVYLMYTGRDIGIVAEQICQSINQNYTILAVPMFVLMAEVMNSSSISNRLFDFCKALVGKRRGALAYVNVLISLIFSGMSGSAVADASGIGLIEVKAMKDDGYDDKFSAALTSATSTVGPIIPPSIPLVIYSTISGASVGGLFLGGITPGVILSAALAVYVFFVSKKRGYPPGHDYTFKQFLSFAWKAVPALLTPVILFSGIYGGVMTPTEAGAAAALYAVIVAMFVYRSIDLKGVVQAFKRTALQTGVITVMTAASVVMSYMVAREGVSAAIANWVLGITDNKALLLLAINLVFIVLGMFLDVSVIQYVFVPLVLPIVMDLGVSVVHFGIVIVLNMMIGLSSPPFGMCLFISSSISGAKLASVSKEILPMVAVLIVVLLLITYVPDLVMWLPRIAGYA